MTLTQIAAHITAQRSAPVERWHPAETLDSGMDIRADGSWWHNGAPIGRPAMVRAFAGLLMRDKDGAHWLVTPQDRQSIRVADAAFIAVDVARKSDDSGESALVFRLNTDELVIAGPDHPIAARGDADTPAIYLGVRHGCEARLNRSTWGQLVDIALENGADNALTDGGLTVDSLGISFALVPA